MNIKIRLEQESDYRTVEELTREAFWNLHAMGCDEHLLVHKLRTCAAFIPGLSFVALKDGRIVGHIIYSLAKITDETGADHQVISFGPLSVLPALQNQGIGKALVEHSIKAAADMGCRAILIYGYPAYYSRFGFEEAKTFGIRTGEGKFMKALMALPLVDGALNGISGRFFEDPVFHIDPAETEAFDQTFPYKRKFVTDSQRAFQQSLKDMTEDAE